MTNNAKIIKIIIVFIIIVFIAVVTYSITTVIYRSDKNKVNIYTVPTDAEISLNDKKIPNQINYLKSGQYKVSVKKDGFFASETIVNIQSSDDIIAVALIPESTEAKKWTDNNNGEYINLEKIVSDKYAAEAYALKKANPILEHLPHKDYLFHITYREDASYSSDQSIVIIINAEPELRQLAYDQFKKWGYDLKDFNYEFKNFENRFKL